MKQEILKEAVKEILYEKTESIETKRHNAFYIIHDIYRNLEGAYYKYLKKSREIWELGDYLEGNGDSWLKKSRRECLDTLKELDPKMHKKIENFLKLSAQVLELERNKILLNDIKTWLDKHIEWENQKNYE
jgi:hypothetical protein